MKKPAATIVVAGVTLLGSSPFLLDFLAKWESGGRTQLVVYEDKLAGGLPTVCDGLTKHVTATPIILGERWSIEKCEAETQKAVLKTQNKLAKCFTKAPNQMVFDMATSHAWNNGVSATCSSLAMKAWNEGEWELGCKRLAVSDAGKLVWSYICSSLPNGNRHCVFIQGLADRRNDEWAYCGGSLNVNPSTPDDTGETSSDLSTERADDLPICRR